MAIQDSTTTRLRGRRARGRLSARQVARREQQKAERRATLDIISGMLHGAASDRSDSVDAALAAALASARPLVDGPYGALGNRHFVASALVRLTVETDCDLVQLHPAVRTIADEFDLDPVEIGLQVLSDPLLLGLPLDACASAVTGLLMMLAPVEEVSLWMGRHPAIEAAAAAGVPTLVPILCWRQQCAALAFVAEPDRELEALAIVERAALLLGPAFQQASLIEGNIARSEALAATAQRRLTRLGFDLHDGPLQDVAVLAGDLDNLRRRVEETVGSTSLGQDLLSQLEGATAIAKFLDGDLRDLANSLDGTSVARARLEDVVANVVRQLGARSDVEVDLKVTGDTEILTHSQKITLTRVIQEALSNVREHSGATNVRIKIDVDDSQVEALIVDDGCGFDVAECMRAAGSAGRMGLAGMVERVRLLGGVCDISSRRGGGTYIYLSIARWVPVPEKSSEDPGQAVAASGA